MQIFIFVYNILLIMLYSTALTSSLYAYYKSKKPVFLMVGLMFILFIFDNTIIYMTEFIDSFSRVYDTQFMSAPAFKTAIVLGTALIYLYINALTLKEKISNLNYLPLAIYTLTLVFVPLIKTGALRVWCFYFPAQVYLFYLSFYGIYKMKKSPNNYLDPFFKKYKKMLIISMIFCILIVMEDTIVIFNFDIYSSMLVKINNRSITEDILSIYYSFFFLRHFICDMNFDTAKEVLPLAAPLSESDSNPTFIRVNNTLTLFVNQHHLTIREEEILEMLLEDKSNLEISQKLFISLGTVKTHIHNIYQKVGISRRNELLRTYHHFLETQETVSHT